MPRRSNHRRRTACALSRSLEPLESRTLLTAAYTGAIFTQFTGGGIGTNGYQPDGLVMAANGDFYGETGLGGADGYGALFKIAAGTNKVISLVSFNGKDGILPRGGMVVDAQGDVFGTTSSGGVDGVGTLFEYSASAGKLITLVSFNRTNGAYPETGVVADAAGNLYGSTVGFTDSPDRAVIFKWVASSSTLTTLAVFPTDIGLGTSLTVDAQGDIFGTTRTGGPDGLGRIFEIHATSSSVTYLASFNGANGEFPHGGLVLDSEGDIFGTSGGGVFGFGAAFEWYASSSKLISLASFQNVVGSAPVGQLVMNADGDLFGVASFGGGDGLGSVFEIVPNGVHSTITRLHPFWNEPNGEHPDGPLIIDSTGDIFVPAFSGGNGNFGLIFELIPTGAAQVPIKIVLAGSPKNATAGHTLSGTITAKIEDVHGKVVTGDDDTLTLEILTGPTLGTLTGTVTVAAVNGTAVFTGISLPIAGNYTLAVTDDTRTSNPTGQFTISADTSSPTAVITQVPENATHGKLIKPAILVKIEDQFGNVITADHPKVTLALASGPNGGTLTGTQTLTASNGVAAFSGLTLNLPGTYTLVATAGTLTPVTSMSFTLT